MTRRLASQDVCEYIAPRMPWLFWIAFVVFGGFLGFVSWAALQHGSVPVAFLLVWGTFFLAMTYFQGWLWGYRVDFDGKAITWRSPLRSKTIDTADLQAVRIGERQRLCSFRLLDAKVLMVWTPDAACRERFEESVNTIASVVRHLEIIER